MLDLFKDEEGIEIAKVKLSSLMSSKFNFVQNEFDIPTDTLEELFEKLDSYVSGLKACIIMEPGIIKPFIAIFINDEKIGKKYYDIALNDNDNITIFFYGP